MFSLLHSVVPTGWFPGEITIPGADIHGAFSIDQTGPVVNCQGHKDPRSQTHELPFLIPASQPFATPEGFLLIPLRHAAPKSITHWIKLQVIKQAKLDLQDLEWLEDAVSAFARISDLSSFLFPSFPYPLSSFKNPN